MSTAAESPVTSPALPAREAPPDTPRPPDTGTLRPPDTGSLPTQRRTGAPGTSSWHAFGGLANVVVADRNRLETAAGLAAELVSLVQRHCEASRPSSHLARANRCAGDWVEVDPLVVDAVGAAVRVARATAGLVGPRHWTRIGLDPDGSRIRVPVGTQLDLGTTLRAFAADLVAAEVPRRAGTPLIIALGGDVAVGTLADRPQEWRVTLTESASGSGNGDGAEQVLLETGGLATAALPFGPREAGVPHLVDPRTGLPIEVTWRSVTVSAVTCLDAHAAAGAALLMGELAPAWLWEHDLAARLVAADSRCMRVAGWPIPA
jgi:thiamine biosynthesis lipoprotein